MCLILGIHTPSRIVCHDDLNNRRKISARISEVQNETFAKMGEGEGRRPSRDDFQAATAECGIVVPDLPAEQD